MNPMKTDHNNPSRVLTAEIATEINQEEITERLGFLISDGVRNPFNGIMYRYNGVTRSGRLRLRRIGSAWTIYPAIDVLIEPANVGSHISLRSSVQAVTSSSVAIVICLMSPVAVIVAVANIIGKSYVAALLIPLFLGVFVTLGLLGMRRQVVDTFNQDVRLLRWFLSAERPY